MLGWTRFIARAKTTPSLLHSREHFQAMLDRERSRVDRVDGNFTVLALELQQSPLKREATLIIVGQILRDRLRTSDLTGFLADNRIGVLLADTELSGAQQLADSIRDSFAVREIRVSIAVYRYPDEELPSGTDAVGSPNAADDPKPSAAIYIKQMPLWKRTVDVIGAAIGLVVLSPLLLATTVLIKLTSPGPVFFLQPRSGLGNVPFTLFKFRTMCTDAEAQKATLMAQNEQDGPAFKIKDDPRITPFGKFLRKSCIDELPQLVNVLRGDMTLVGPRPLPCDEADRCQPWEQRRLTVTPGLTCTWQAGARRVTFAEWMRMDLRYIRERSLRRDVRLLWATFLKVIRNKASH